MLYDRVANLKILLSNPPPALDYYGEIDITNLRIAFNITKSESWSTNSASIRVWNLSESTRNKLRQFGDLVTLNAGYVENAGPQLLFLGNTTQTSHSFDFPDVITYLECMDGDKSINNTLIRFSYASNVLVKTVIQGYADALQLNISTTNEFNSLSNQTYANGHRFSGLARDGLDVACNAIGAVWSVQNGSLVILKQFTGSDKPPVDININTGMIGVPQRYGDRRQLQYSVGYNTGWKVRTLLRPDILPGDRIRLRSEKVGIDSVFYVIKCRHQGDTYGDVFESEFEVIQV